MFPGKARSAQAAAGLPSLLGEMRNAQISTPRRMAAFLTTLAFESLFDYSIHQFNDTRPYAGRGYIQLTGQANYDAAGKALGVDLVGHPELAQSIEWSAKIAIWYWTKARPKCNQYADALQMGKVNGAIGYPLTGTNDQQRCTAFAGALKYLTGEVPDGITCTR